MDGEISLKEKLKHPIWNSVLFRRILLLLILNTADLFLSLRAFSQGMDEFNPLMRMLFETNLYLGSAVKLSLVTVSALLLLNFRQSTMAIRGTTFATSLYAGVFLYHLYFLGG